VMAELPAVVEALTGKSFEEIAKRIPGVQTPPPASEANGAAAEAESTAEEIK
jgi:ribosomal protein L12E/L44/L45/RPP1/RPP2